MNRRLMLCLRAFVLTSAVLVGATEIRAERAFGRTWGAANSYVDWDRFYHYPYLYYPQNFWSREYYRSGDSLYYRYPPEMRIPVYNKRWYNYYPTERVYHRGHHFQLDVF